MSEMKLCKDCGHFNDRNGECYVARLDLVTGDQQKLPAIESRRYYCGVNEARDFKPKEPPKPKEPEHKGCPFCGSDVSLVEENSIFCSCCRIRIQSAYYINSSQMWELFNRRAEDRLPEIRGCLCGGISGLIQSEAGWYSVVCSNRLCARKGHEARTRRGAIENWNG